MTQEDDFDLVKRAQKGERAAFATLVERHYGLMFKVAWKWCGVQEDAEDIAQDCAIKLARQVNAFRFESAFTTWLYRVVINTAKDYYKAKNRRQAREKPMFDDVIDMASEAPDAEQTLQNKDLLATIHALPVKMKEAVILVCWQGLSHREAAVALECSEGTISWRIHEARKKIAEGLDPTKRSKRHG